MSIMDMIDNKLKPSDVIKIIKAVVATGVICDFEYGDLKFKVSNNIANSYQIEPEEYIKTKKTPTRLEKDRGYEETIPKDTFTNNLDVAEEELNTLLVSEPHVYEELMLSEEIMGERNASED